MTLQCQDCQAYCKLSEGPGLFELHLTASLTSSGGPRRDPRPRATWPWSGSEVKTRVRVSGAIFNGVGASMAVPPAQATSQRRERRQLDAPYTRPNPDNRKPPAARACAPGGLPSACAASSRPAHPGAGCPTICPPRQQSKPRLAASRRSCTIIYAPCCSSRPAGRRSRRE
jgi:hypothetical protein